jgi:hypothetical protein
MSSDSISLPPNNEPEDHKPHSDGAQQAISPSPGPPKSNNNPNNAGCGTQKEKPKRDWYDKLNLAVLIGAFLAAIAAAYEAGRLANLTETAVSHADVAAKLQHVDTLAALQRAEDANTTAKNTSDRQARDTASALALSREEPARLLPKNARVVVEDVAVAVNVC